MAVRIHQTRRRRPSAVPELADLTSVWVDESAALLEATDHVVDKIDEATATS